MNFPLGLENGYASRLLRRFRALRTLVLDRMGNAPAPSAALDAVRRTQTVAASVMAPEPRAFMSDAKALEVAVTRDVARSLKADPKSVEWQKPQVDALLQQWATTQARLAAKLEADVLEDVAERVRDAPEGADLRAIVTARFAANEARARFIARNELGNLMAALVQLRAKGMGANRYRWRSRDDARVRPLHAALDDTIRSWDDPHPTEGHPGDSLGCRCVAEPLRDAPLATSKAKVAVTPAAPAAVLPPRPPAPKPAPKPKPIAVPQLTVPQVPVVSTPLPQWTPGALPSFGAGQVSPFAPPVLAPKATIPALPELQIPVFPPPRPRPAATTIDELLARTYRAFRTEREVRAYGAELATVREPFTRPEKIAVIEYTGSEYIPINAALRAGRTHPTARALDAAIERAVIPEDIQVHRGLRAHPALANMDLVQVGDIITDNAYVSTTLDRMASFPGSLKLHINVPKGSKALWVDDVSANQGEYELLLPRNSRLQITKLEYIGNAWHIDCLLLPTTP